jgi:hypothetical protein
MNQSSGVGLVRDSTKPSSRWTVTNRDANFGTKRLFCKSRGSNPLAGTRCWQISKSGTSRRRTAPKHQHGRAIALASSDRWWQVWARFDQLE